MTDSNITDDKNILYKEYYEMGVDMAKEDTKTETDDDDSC